MSSIEDVATRWVAGLSTGDLMVLAPLTSATMRVWHSTDGMWLTAAESQERMAAAAQLAPTVPPSFTQVRAHVTPTGFVVQAVLEQPGAPPVHVVQMCTVEHGVVVVCEEYLAAQATA